MDTDNHPPRTAAHFTTLPSEVRNMIFGYLIPEKVELQSHELLSSGYSKTFPKVHSAFNVAAVCRQFDREYTHQFYQSLEFAVTNWASSLKAGTAFLQNLRPSTIGSLPVLLVKCVLLDYFQSCRWKLAQRTNEEARGHFCVIAKDVALKCLRLIVSVHYCTNVEIPSTLPDVPWIQLFFAISDVTKLSVFFNEDVADRSALQNLLDNLNGSGVTATAPGYKIAKRRKTSGGRPIQFP